MCLKCSGIFLDNNIGIKNKYKYHCNSCGYDFEDYFIIFGCIVCPKCGKLITPNKSDVEIDMG